MLSLTKKLAKSFLGIFSSHPKEALSESVTTATDTADVAAPSKEVWDIVPDFFNTVPLQLVELTLSHLAHGNKPDSRGPQAHMPVRGSVRGSGTLSYAVTRAYFIGGVLRFNVLITYFSRDYSDTATSTSCIDITMHRDGTIPHWTNACASISVEELKKDKLLRDKLYLSKEAELWLRVIYLTDGPELHCDSYIREQSSKDLLVKAIRFIDRHNVPFNNQLV